MIRARAAVACLAVLLTAACGSTPSSSSAATSSPTVLASPAPISIPPLTVTFTSPTEGFSVMYPAGWTVTPAAQAWPLGKESFWDTPDGDRLEGDGAGFRGTSQALASGQSASAWVDQYIASQMTCGTREEIPVAGQVGTIDLNDCPGMGRLGGRVFDIAVVAGGRGYNFTMEGRIDRAFFLAMLATVTFHPEAAKT